MHAPPHQQSGVSAVALSNLYAMRHWGRPKMHMYAAFRESSRGRTDERREVRGFGFAAARMFIQPAVPIRSRDCENTSPLRPYIDRLRPHCNSTPTRRLSLISRTPKLKKETRPGRWWWWLLLREPVAAHMARADSTCRPESPAIRACSVPTIGTQPQARMAGRREQPLPQVARLPRGASCHLS